jgi:hypothetical protein
MGYPLEIAEYLRKRWADTSASADLAAKLRILNLWQAQYELNEKVEYEDFGGSDVAYDEGMADGIEEGLEIALCELVQVYAHRDDFQPHWRSMPLHNTEPTTPRPPWEPAQTHTSAAKPTPHLREYEVWCEGYAANSERGCAHRIGVVAAESFPEACDRLCSSAEFQKGHGEYDPKNLTVWGCNLFDNRHDAQRAFG